VAEIRNIEMSLVYRRNGDAEKVLEVRLTGDEGETVAYDWITAADMRDWLGIEAVK
jgi:hypothetical protein